MNTNDKNKELEKKWIKEALLIRFNIVTEENDSIYFSKTFEEYLNDWNSLSSVELDQGVQLYLAAKKSSQVEIDRLKTENEMFAKDAHERFNQILSLQAKLKEKDEEIVKVVNDLSPDCPDSGAYLDLHCSLYELVTTTVDKLKQELKAEREAVDMISTEKVNEYDVIKMLKDVKRISIDHGGYQNAYSISHVVKSIEVARETQKKRSVIV